MKKSLLLILSAVMVCGLFIMGCKGARQAGRQQVYKNPLATAEDTVKAFCDLDAKGTRLTSEKWPEMLPYISWQEEPGWDSAVVITGYQLTKVLTQSATSARITVEYQVTGNISRDYTPGKTVQTVTFSVRKTDAGWKIKSPDFLPPHVLPKPLAAHLEETKNIELAEKVRGAPKE